jgi:hypothetical protein
MISAPFPSTSSNSNRFFFDFGPGCVKNMLAMGVWGTGDQ